MNVARIIDWQVRPGEVRCRADLTKANSDSKCEQWIREFVWLDNKHLVVLDIIQTPTPEIRRQWQLHATSRPELGDHVLAVTSQAPDQHWPKASLKPKSREGRLFCQTLIPHDYRLILYDEGECEAFDPTGKLLGPVEGNADHREYGRKVVQIDPGNVRTKTIFLHVLTATGTEETTPPEAAFQVSTRGDIQLSVNRKTVSLSVPEWFAETQ
jgi:hypothetical protein